MRARAGRVDWNLITAPWRPTLRGWIRRWRCQCSCERTPWVLALALLGRWTKRAMRGGAVVGCGGSRAGCKSRGRVDIAVRVRDGAEGNVLAWRSAGDLAFGLAAKSGGADARRAWPRC